MFNIMYYTNIIVSIRSNISSQRKYTYVNLRNALKCQW